LGKNADEADAEEIIKMASKASFVDQQMQVQENVHSQIKAFCSCMNEILLSNKSMVNGHLELSQQASSSPLHSGLSSAKGICDPPNNIPSDFYLCLNFSLPLILLSHFATFCSLLSHFPLPFNPRRHRKNLFY